MLKGFEIGLVSFYSKVKSLTLVDIDMQFTKVKDPSGPPALAYTEFRTLIKALADIVYKSEKVVEIDTSDQSELVTSPSNSRPGSSKVGRHSSEGKKSIRASREFKSRSKSREIDSSSRERLIFNLDSLQNDSKYIDLFVWLLIIAANRTEPVVISVLDWLELESRARLSVYAKKIQTISKVRQTRIWKEIFKTRKETQKRLELRDKAAEKVILLILI
jgi:hypothetical protein